MTDSRGGTNEDCKEAKWLQSGRGGANDDTDKAETVTDARNGNSSILITFLH